MGTTNQYTNSTTQTTGSYLPSQIKGKKDDNWAKACVDYYLTNSKFKNSRYITYFKKFERFYSGDFNQTDLDDFAYAANPITGTKSKITTSKVRNYNIIQPTLNLLFGEKAKRPLNDTVIVTNPDSISLKEEIKHKQLRDLMLQTLNQMIEAEMTGEGQVPNIDFEKAISDFNAKYKDHRAIVGQNALEYIKQYNKVYHKFNELFKDFIKFGRAHTIKEVINDEVYYVDLEPYDVDYSLARDQYLVEEADWAVVRRRMSISSIIDYLRNDIPDEDIILLEKTGELSQGTVIGDSVSEAGIFELMSVYWRSKRKAGICYYMDEYGIPQMKEVDEDYKSSFGDVLEWYWVDEIWEGHKIESGTFSKYYRLRPFPVQRTKLDKSGARLPVNGIVHLHTDNEPWSLLKMGIPYQQLYIIFWMRLEASIARAKDAIALIDINSVPDQLGLELFFEYLDKLGIGFVDFNKDDVKFSNTHQTVLDLTNKMIEYYIMLLNHVIQSFERQVGITKERQGQVGHYQGKGVTERSVVQSSHITEDLFRIFTMFEQSELQGLLDTSKWAWSSGKQAHFRRKDGELAFLNINPIEYCEAELGVFVDNSSDSQEKLQLVRNLALPMLQNNVALSTVLDIIDSDNFSEIKHKIKELEEMQAKQEQAVQQAEQEAELAKAQREADNVALQQQRLGIEQQNADANTVKAQAAYSQKSD